MPKTTKKKSRSFDSFRRYGIEAKKAGLSKEGLLHFLNYGVQLQEKQLAASAAAEEADIDGGPTEIGYGGAAGGGKSYWAFAQAIVRDLEKYPGTKALFLRKVKGSIKEAVQELRDKVLNKVPHKYTPSRSTITLPNGSHAVIGGFSTDSDLDKYLGLEYPVIVVEEATTIKAEYLKRIRTRNRGPIDGIRPRMYYTTNPGGVSHKWFKSKFIDPMRRGTQTTTRFIQATAKDNAFLDKDYINKLEELTGAMRKMWLEGDWDLMAGAYYSTFRMDAHVQPFDLDSSWTYWLGFDYGWNHMTSAVLLAQDNDGYTRACDMHFDRLKLPDYHSDQIKGMVSRHNLGWHRIESIEAGGDCFNTNRDGKKIIDDYRSNGLILTRANMARIDGATEILRLLGDPAEGRPGKLIIHPRCQKLYDTLPYLEVDPNRPEDVLKWDLDPEDENFLSDDYYDSFRYGVMKRKKIRQQARRKLGGI